MQKNLALEIYFVAVAMVAALVQKLAIVNLKSNAETDWTSVFLEATIVGLSLVYMTKKNNWKPEVMTNVCSEVLDFSAERRQELEVAYYYATDYGHYRSFQIIVSVNICVYTIYTVLQLKRT